MTTQSRETRTTPELQREELAVCEQLTAENELRLSDPSSYQKSMFRLLALANTSIMYREIAFVRYSLGEDPDTMRPAIAKAAHWHVQHQLENEADFAQYGDLRRLWPDTPVWMIEAAQLLSLVVLLGTEEQRTKIAATLPLMGPETMLEFLAGVHGTTLDGVEVELSQPRPYGRLIKVIQAAPDDRPKLMADFVKHWYNGCRKARWWGMHIDAEKNGYPLKYEGYWCVEAAAVTKLLGIDDSLYRDNEYYPRDLLPRNT